MSKKEEVQATPQQHENMFTDCEKMRGKIAEAMIEELKNYGIWKNMREADQKRIVWSFNHRAGIAIHDIMEIFVAQGMAKPIKGTLKKVETVPKMAVQIENVQRDDDSILRLSKNGSNEIYILPGDLAKFMGEAKEKDLVIPDQEELLPEEGEDVDLPTMEEAEEADEKAEAAELPEGNEETSEAPEGNPADLAKSKK